MRTAVTRRKVLLPDMNTDQQPKTARVKCHSSQLCGSVSHTPPCIRISNRLPTNNNSDATVSHLSLLLLAAEHVKGLTTSISASMRARFGRTGAGGYSRLTCNQNKDREKASNRERELRRIRCTSTCTLS